MDSKLKMDCSRQYPQHFLQMLLISFASGNTSRFPKKSAGALCEKVVPSAKIETWQMRALWCAFILI